MYHRTLIILGYTAAAGIIAYCFRFFMDSQRIKIFLEDRQSVLLHVHPRLTPRGFNIFSITHACDYWVKYEDAMGRICKGHCRITLFESVEWNEGPMKRGRSAVVNQACSEALRTSLNTKNQALQQKIEALRKAHYQQKEVLEQEVAALESELQRLSL